MDLRTITTLRNALRASLSAAALVFTSMTLFVSPVDAQHPSPAGAESAGSHVDDVVRELVQKIQEQQKSLDEKQKSIDEQQRYILALIGQLQRTLGTSAATGASTAGGPIVPAATADHPCRSARHMP